MNSMIIFAVVLVAALILLILVANIDYWSLSAEDRRRADRETDWNW